MWTSLNRLLDLIPPSQLLAGPHQGSGKTEMKTPSIPDLKQHMADPTTTTTTREEEKMSSKAPHPKGREPWKDRDDMAQKNYMDWLAQKRASDRILNNSEPHLWLIHGKLYDLSDYMDKHPGGTEWLELNRGTDCTEAFEAHHLNIEKARAVLKKFYVKDAKPEKDVIQRFSFDKGGFYDVLRERVRKELGTERGPTMEMYLTSVFIVLAWTYFCADAVFYHSYRSAVISGFLTLGCWGVGHNFMHQGDNLPPLRYAMSLTGFSVRGFRVTHCLSHHLYPNLYHDIEVSGLEPLIYFLPASEKKHPVIYNAIWPLVLAAVPLLRVFGRTVNMIIGKEELRLEFLVHPFLIGLFCYYNPTLSSALSLYCTMMGVFGLSISILGLMVHHGIEDNGVPTAWHEGMMNPRADFGEHQVRACVDHSIDMGLFPSMLFFAYLTFHSVHHLFPSVDHSRYLKILPVLQETCKEFDIEHKVSTPVFEMIPKFIRHVIQGSPRCDIPEK